MTSSNLRLAIVQIGTTNLPAARRFYGEILGFPEKNPSFGPDFASFDLGGGQTLLLYPATAGQERQSYPDSTGTVPIFVVSDIQTTVASLREAGIELVPAAWADERGLASCPFGVFIGVRDPSGNVVELLERVDPS